MRWFKHMTAAYNDQRLAAMVDELGLEGYGFWWRLLEVLAAEVAERDDIAMDFSPKKWAAFFGFSPKKFEKFVKVLEKNGLCSAKFLQNSIRIEVPNLLNFKDDYTRKREKMSGHCTDIVRTQDKIIYREEEEKNKIQKDNVNTNSVKNTPAPAQAFSLSEKAQASLENPKRQNALPYKMQDKGKGEMPVQDKTNIAQPNCQQCSKCTKEDYFFIPPTLEDVANYCQKMKIDVVPKQFYYYHRACGWKMGSRPMYDWQAAVHVWEHNEEEKRKRREALLRQAMHNVPCN